MPGSRVRFPPFPPSSHGPFRSHRLPLLRTSVLRLRTRRAPLLVDELIHSALGRSTSRLDPPKMNFRHLKKRLRPTAIVDLRPLTRIRLVAIEIRLTSVIARHHSGEFPCTPRKDHSSGRTRCCFRRSSCSRVACLTPRPMHSALPVKQGWLPAPRSNRSP